jgi:hypothetical protein
VKEERKDERERKDKIERKKMREREKIERRWKGFSFTMIQKSYRDNKLTYSRREREDESGKREEEK